MAFGELKNAKLIAMNAPKFTSAVEPFGDSGTVLLYPGFKKVRSHTLNIVDEAMFNLFLFLQAQPGKAGLKSRDWVSSQEAFDAALALNATEGADLYYRFFYLKKFGVRSKDPAADPTYDLLTIGEDMSNILFTLPIYKIGLKKATITNDDAMTALNGAGGAFAILAPKKPEDVQAVEGKLPGMSGEFIFLKKSLDSASLIESAKSAGDLTISTFAASSIMMQDMEVRTNYEHKSREKLKIIDPATLEGVA